MQNVETPVIIPKPQFGPHERFKCAKGAFMWKRRINVTN